MPSNALSRYTVAEIRAVIDGMQGRPFTIVVTVENTLDRRRATKMFGDMPGIRVFEVWGRASFLPRGIEAATTTDLYVLHERDVDQIPPTAAARMFWASAVLPERVEITTSFERKPGPGHDWMACEASYDPENGDVMVYAATEAAAIAELREDLDLGDDVEMVVMHDIYLRITLGMGFEHHLRNHGFRSIDLSGCGTSEWRDDDGTRIKIRDGAAMIDSPFSLAELVRRGDIKAAALADSFLLPPEVSAARAAQLDQIAAQRLSA